MPTHSPLPDRQQRVSYSMLDHPRRWRPTPKIDTAAEPLRNRGATHTPLRGEKQRPNPGTQKPETQKPKAASISMGNLVAFLNSCLRSPTCGHFDMRLHWLSSGGLLILFPHFPEALQTLPALRDIRDGPVELLGQRLVRVLGPAVRFQAAKLLVIFFCPGTRYFRGRDSGEENRPAQGETGAGAGVRGAGRAGGSGEFVFSEDVARHLFRLVLRRSVPFLSMMERGILAFLMPGWPT